MTFTIGNKESKRKKKGQPPYSLEPQSIKWDGDIVTVTFKIMKREKIYFLDDLCDLLCEEIAKMSEAEKKEIRDTLDKNLLGRKPK